MVDSQVLKIVLKMVDEASKVAEKVDKNIQKIGDTSKKTSNATQTSSKITQNALRQQEQSTNKLGQAYNKLNTTVQNVFNKIKNTIKNSKPAQYIKESSLAQPFLNAAEKIRSTWQTKMQQVKNITSSLSSNLTPSFNRISNTASNTATRISNVFTNAKGKITQAFNEIQRGYNYGYNPLRMVVDTSQARNSISLFFAQANALESRKVATSRSRWGKIGSTISSTFTKLNSRLIRINNALGPLSIAIAGAFGAIGVSSISQFTIGAAMAREKINSVTTSITGSKQATKELGETIKSATAGGVVGFNNTAQALNQVAIKFHMNTSQMKAAAPAIANIGNLSVAMGHSQEQAANMMAHAYDGLNGNFRTLRQNLGVTKDQLMQAGWSGAADDVDGYTDALNRVLEQSPKLQEYYNSTEGRITRAKMTIQAVGREIGETLLPILSKVLKAFLDFHKKNPEITKAFLYLGLAIMGLSSISMVILPIVELARVLKIASAAQWLLNAAMDANPIGIIIIAITALIAILAYLYFNNEEVRKAMNDFAAFIYGGLSSA